MKFRTWLQWGLLLLAAVALVGCATPRDHDIDVDALLRELELDQTPREQARAAVPAPRPAPEAPLAAEMAPAAPGAHAQSQAESELTIQPDSLVQITIEEDPALNGTYPVNEIGAVKLGYVGPVILFNRTEVEAAEKIREILTSRHFRNATVQVRIIRASYDKIRVGGDVHNGGLIKIGAGDSISLNDALLRAGGLKSAARNLRVKVVRGGLLSAVALAYEGEVYALADEAGRPDVPDVELRNNDIVHVFVPGPGVDTGAATGMEIMGEPKTILVLGEVKRPGFYNFAPNEPCTLMHLLFRMGGQFSSVADMRKLQIVRIEDGFESVIRVDAAELLKEGNVDLNVPLEDGDRIIFPQRRLSLF